MKSLKKGVLSRRRFWCVQVALWLYSAAWLGGVVWLWWISSLAPGLKLAIGCLALAAAPDGGVFHGYEKYLAEAARQEKDMPEGDAAG